MGLLYAGPGLGEVVLATVEEAADEMAAQGAAAGEEYIVAPGMIGVEQVDGEEIAVEIAAVGKVAAEKPAVEKLVPGEVTAERKTSERILGEMLMVPASLEQVWFSKERTLAAIFVRSCQLPQALRDQSISMCRNHD